MDKKPEPSESRYDKLLDEYNDLAAHYRGAVKWLLVARQYQREFAAETWDSTRSDMEVHLCNDSKIAFAETYRDVVRFRKNMIRLKKELVELAKKEDGSGR